MASHTLSIDIYTLEVQFTHRLSPAKIPQLRGAVAEAAGWEQDLFHNHNNLEVHAPQSLEGDGDVQALTRPKAQLKTTYFSRYPKIQYRSMGGKATIFSLNEGRKAIKNWLMQAEDELEIQGKKIPILIENLQERKHTLSMLSQPRLYRLMDYVPFNSENYEHWQRAADLHERIELLERILAGNIITLAHHLDWRLPKRLEVKLMAIREMKTVRVHKTQRIAFNLIYKANIDLPPGIALGRSVAFGFGVQQPTRTQA
ncbi:MAG: CRISPR-associated endonuclease Cas6 [Bacteroidota bacterium]